VNSPEKNDIFAEHYQFMLSVAKGLDRNYSHDLVHDVFIKLQSQDITINTNIKGFLFRCLVNQHISNTRTYAHKHVGYIGDFDIPINDFIDTDKLNRLTDFELEIISLLMAYNGNISECSKKTKISRKSLDKYKNTIFAKLK
jgi:DNA-directed RNA polymerase specialized sigma24 family protein